MKFYLLDKDLNLNFKDILLFTNILELLLLFYLFCSSRRIH